MCTLSLLFTKRLWASMIQFILRLFKSSHKLAQEEKFAKAREAKAIRLLIEQDKKREAVDHPLN